MKSSSRKGSRTDFIVCPRCEVGELRLSGPRPVTCTFCTRSTEDAVLETLLEIVVLPDALGSHACECGHPEMRLLPDGVYRCPACGSEVLPASTGPTLAEREYPGEA